MTCTAAEEFMVFSGNICQKEWDKSLKKKEKKKYINVFKSCVQQCFKPA